MSTQQFPRVDELLLDGDFALERADDLIYALACSTASGGSVDAIRLLRAAEADVPLDRVAAFVTLPETGHWDGPLRVQVLRLAADATSREDIRQALRTGAAHIDGLQSTPAANWRAELERVELTRFDARWDAFVPPRELDIAVDGRRATVRARATHSGSEWSFPWGDVRALPGDDALLNWHPPDGSTPIETRVLVERADPLADQKAAVAALNAWRTLALTDLLRLAMGVADAFLRGPFADALRQGAQEVLPPGMPAGARADGFVDLSAPWLQVPGGAALAEDVDPGAFDVLADRVALALQARLLLATVADELDSTPLLARLGEVDDELAAHGPALALVDQRLYERLTEDELLDPEAWWGWRAGPGPGDGELLELLALPQTGASATESWAAKSSSGTEHRMVAIPLLLEQSGKGRVAHLRIDLGGGLWGPTAGFGHEVFPAVVAAYRAVGALLQGRVPPYALGQHRIHLDGAPSGGVDGPSLGLPVALAFASLWSGGSGTLALWSTGAVTERGAVKGVGGIAAKSAAALHRHATRIVVPSSNADQVVDGLPAVPVETVADAVRIAEIDVSRTPKPGRTNLQAVRDRVEELVKAIERQALPSSGVSGVAGVSPYALLAEELAMHVAHLRAVGSTDTAIATRGSVWAALGQLLGGSLAVARDLLQDQEIDAAIDNATARQRPELRALLETARLACSIRIEFWDDAEKDANRLIGVIDALSGEHRARAEGTLGRYLAHRFGAARAEDALVHLDRSLSEWQESGVSQEIPRSLVYKAQILRVLGRDADARNALDDAEARLVGLREEDVTYAHSTTMFVLYERARLELRAGHRKEALALAEAARERSEQLGWGPLAGILRTLSCAADPGDPRRASAIATLEALRTRPDALPSTHRAYDLACRASDEDVA